MPRWDRQVLGQVRRCIAFTSLWEEKDVAQAYTQLCSSASVVGTVALWEEGRRHYRRQVCGDAETPHGYWEDSVCSWRTTLLLLCLFRRHSPIRRYSLLGQTGVSCSASYFTQGRDKIVLRSHTSRGLKPVVFQNCASPAADPPEADFLCVRRFHF